MDKGLKKSLTQMTNNRSKHGWPVADHTFPGHFAKDTAAATIKVLLGEQQILLAKADTLKHLRCISENTQDLYRGGGISVNIFDRMIQDQRNFCQLLLTSDFWEDPTTETLVDLLLDPTTVTLMDLLLDPNKLLASEE